MQDMDDGDEGSAAYTFKEPKAVDANEEEDWPDPVKVEKEARPLTEGMEKLILTMVMPDKSTKKAFATKDFTCAVRIF
jgi:hypothetical protein